jgi:threonine/homoserine/homoserine lactone efflux protein
MSIELYLAYVFACVVVVVVPGPTVSLIVANSLKYGPRAGMLNVAGTQLGLAVMVGIVVVGLASLIETMSWWFDWVRLLGAAYLVWLGIRLLRSPVTPNGRMTLPPPRLGFFMQGFLVLMSNPKALLLFGAFIPQFVNPAGDYVGQVILLGITAMAAAFVFDSAYAILAGRAASQLAGGRLRWVSRISGMFLVGGGAWLALARAR